MSVLYLQGNRKKKCVLNTAALILLYIPQQKFLPEFPLQPLALTPKTIDFGTFDNIIR